MAHRSNLASSHGGTCLFAEDVAALTRMLDVPMQLLSNVSVHAATLNSLLNLSALSEVPAILVTLLFSMGKVLPDWTFTGGPNVLEW